MPSANKTTNIKLNQWQGNEYPKRQDFLNDNQIIDTEIGNLKNIAHGAVADLAALKSIDTTNLSDNITIIVKTLGFYRFDSTSTLTADDNSVVQPTTGSGRWINDLALHNADNVQQFNTINTRINNLNTNDLQARDEIINLKLKLKEQTAINFLDKTGIGFYDTFADNSNIDTANTTAVYDATNKNVDFPYVNYQVKATADYNNVKILNVDSPVTIGDKIDNLNAILDSVIKNTSVTYDRTGITSVVNSACTTSATARPQVLSNGWIVTCAATSVNGMLNFYVSKDQGLTWSLLTSEANVSFTYFAICSYGTRIYLLTTYTSDTLVRFYTFDATTVPGNIGLTFNGATNGDRITIDTQTAFGTGCSIAVNSKGELTAAWCSKNSTYSSSFNLRSAKSVDGGITWTKQDGTSGVDQLTTDNLSNYNISYPYVQYDQNNIPIIIAIVNNAVMFGVTSFVFSSSSWTSRGVYLDQNNHSQNNPVATLQKYGANAGRIWVAWHGTDSIDTSSFNIMVGYSDDNGLTWSTMQKLTSGGYSQYNPCPISDMNGNLYICWHGITSSSSGYSNIRMIKFDYSSWSSITEITNQNVRNMSYPSTCDNYNNFINPITIWQDSANLRVVFYGKWTIGGNSYDITLENTITVTSGQELNIYPSLKVLKMKEETFDTFNNLDLNIYPDKINKVAIKGDVNNSTSVVTGDTDKILTSGDKLFMNGVLNEVLSCTGNYTTNTVTDVTVVNSAYDTSGNGGRKLVKLSNGWLIAGAISKSLANWRLQYYKSTDNGLTWSNLCYMDAESNSGSMCGFAIASKGTRVFVVAFSSVSSTSNAQPVYFYTFDATLVTNTNQSYVSIDSQQGYSSISLVINEAKTELHACWSSRNNTCSSSLNIRYVKGIINSDGSVTWGSVEQITTVNSSSYTGFTNPTIMLFNTVPIIFTQSDFYVSGNSASGQGKNISILKRDNTLFIHANLNANWTSKAIYADTTNTYAQSNPCAIFVPQSINDLANGRIWVAWHGTDNIDTSAYNIRYSYSDDGGATWSAMTKLTSGNVNGQMYPSLTCNKNNEVYLVFNNYIGNNTHQVPYFKYSDNSWSSLTVIGGTSPNNVITYPNALFDLTLDFTIPLFIYSNGAKVGFYGTWAVGEGYNLTMQNPVTLNDGDEVPIVDIEAQQNDANLTLASIDTEKFNFEGSNLNTTTASIKVAGKNNKVDSLVYAVA